MFPRCQYFLFNWKDTMKSWSRNVKKWILFLKITGILVILCMIAGACILYAAENHIQLLKNNLSNEVWESGCEWVWQQIFPLSMDLTGKHSNQTLQTQKKWSSINTMDPAYDQYEKAREFYRTHEYLAWIGEDESDEETIRSASEDALSSRPKRARTKAQPSAVSWASTRWWSLAATVLTAAPVSWHTAASR